MTLKETALINKAKIEMKIWGKVYTHYLKKGNCDSFSTLRANEAVTQFQINFNDYGNVI